MNKKSWWKLPYVPLILTAGLVWATGSTYWYVCQTEILCDSSKNVATKNTNDKIPSLSIDPEPKKTETVPGLSIDPAKDPAKAGPTVPGTKKAYFLPDSPELIQDVDYSEIVKYMAENQSVKINVDGYFANATSLVDGNILSLDRANVIKQQLMAAGVDSGRIKTESKGVDQASSEADPASLANARRAEINITK